MEKVVKLLKTIINLARNKKLLNIIQDQVGAPTSTELIGKYIKSNAFKKYLELNNFSDIYHLSAKGKVSWYHYAIYIIGEISKYEEFKNLSDKINLNPIVSSEYKTSAKRPKNSKLDT